MAEKRYTILKDGDFRIEKHPGKFPSRLNFERLEGVGYTKLFTKKELNDFVQEVEVVAKACNIELPENYFFPYNKEFFGLYANRAQSGSYESGGEVLCALKNFNRLRDFLAGKFVGPA